MLPTMEAAARRTETFLTLSPISIFVVNPSRGIPADRAYKDGATKTLQRHAATIQAANRQLTGTSGEL